MRKKEYNYTIEYTCRNKAKGSEERLQRLFDYITRELLNEYPHLLDKNDTKTG